LLANGTIGKAGISGIRTVRYRSWADNNLPCQGPPIRTAVEPRFSRHYGKGLIL
jgi:hypothetical protein